jgi:hypothetical protein
VGFTGYAEKEERMILAIGGKVDDGFDMLEGIGAVKEGGDELETIADVNKKGFKTPPGQSPSQNLQDARSTSKTHLVPNSSDFEPGPRMGDYSDFDDWTNAVFDHMEASRIRKLKRELKGAHNNLVMELIPGPKPPRNREEKESRNSEAHPAKPRMSETSISSSLRLFSVTVRGAISKDEESQRHCKSLEMIQITPETRLAARASNNCQGLFVTLLSVVLIFNAYPSRLYSTRSHRFDRHP